MLSDILKYKSLSCLEINTSMIRTKQYMDYQKNVVYLKKLDRIINADNVFQIVFDISKSILF